MGGGGGGGGGGYSPPCPPPLPTPMPKDHCPSGKERCHFITRERDTMSLGNRCGFYSPRSGDVIHPQGLGTIPLPYMVESCERCAANNKPYVISCHNFLFQVNNTLRLPGPPGYRMTTSNAHIYGALTCLLLICKLPF